MKAAATRTAEEKLQNDDKNNMKYQYNRTKNLFKTVILGGIAGTLAAMVFAVIPAHADIFKKRLPDGTISFTNCPTGGDWDVYYREPKRYKYNFPRRLTYEPVRKSHYDGLIRQVALNQGVDPDLVKGIIHVESRYNPQALSSKGAMGLMQLMPETASLLGVRDPWDPLDNITGGTKYISYLLKKYNGDLSKALAAYNAGPGAVDAYDGIPPYQETQDYVRHVLGILNGGRR